MLLKKPVAFLIFFTLLKNNNESHVGEVTIYLYFVLSVSRPSVRN